MRVRDMIRALQPGQKKKSEEYSLCTVWSEQAEDGPDAVPLGEYPRPQLKREQWQCLNGWWDYAIRPDGSSMGEPNGQILVPFSPETARSGVRRTLQPGERLWYRRKVELLRVAEGRRLLLHFGAVDERCRVWWNGQRAGDHRNGYLPFTFDVTEYVKPGTNELLVCVRDDTDESEACRGKQTLRPGGMYYPAQSGIWQTVWLEEVPSCYLRDLRITPLMQERMVQLELTFSDVFPAGETGKDSEDGKETVRIILQAPKTAGEHTEAAGDPVKAGGEHMEAAGDPAETVGVFRKKTRMKVKIPVPGFYPWSPEHPYLYGIRLEAGEDLVESYFAMRSFETGTDASGRPVLTLSGEPYFFHGILDQGYWPESLMTPPADEAMVFDIQQMKQCGFNMLRKHVKIEPARWYYHCDRLGMVVWQDMVNGGGPVPKLLVTYLPTVLPWIGRHLPDRSYWLLSRKNAKERARFEADLKQMIRRLYNCPCIGMWVPFNEGWGQFDSLRITEEIKKEDPTRPVDHASGWFDQGGGDVRSVHNYFRTLTVEKSARAFVISEYGGISCAVAGHRKSTKTYGYQMAAEDQFAAAFQAQTERIAKLSREGLSGAVYTQVSDIEEEINGLLTYDRKVKKTG